MSNKSLLARLKAEIDQQYNYEQGNGCSTLLIEILEVLVNGMCSSCVFRDNKGYCKNDKLTEDSGQDKSEKSDMLLYDYSEGGRFWVGPEFGCVHHLSKN